MTDLTDKARTMALASVSAPDEIKLTIFELCDALEAGPWVKGRVPDFPNEYFIIDQHGYPGVLAWPRMSSETSWKNVKCWMPIPALPEDTN